ncbi:hypothetical protein OID55_05845 [Streptomyces sp. NBC_00715]|uniref:hypothetical protein n=1 Tax=Streptomyces sp. NBC_00715 TaxID=2975811 RepID=UPI00386875ED
MTADDSFNRLEDDDYPAYTMGRAAELLGTTQGFLRAIGAARLITPLRSPGGSVKRVASAAGEGAMAIHFVPRHLGHSAAPGTTGTSAATGGSDVSPRLRHQESAWLA